MKKFLIVIVVLGLFICMIGAVFAAKKYEGQTMQVYLGLQPKHDEAVMQYIAPKLEEKYGIKLAVEMAGSNITLEKLIMMKDNPLVTIVDIDSAVAVQANDMGLLAAIDSQKVPNIKDLYDWTIIEDEEGIKILPTKITAIGLLYNEDEFKRNNWDPPTSWEDLWREELSGWVTITAPESTYGLGLLVALARCGGGGEDNIQPGIDKIKSLVPHIHTIHTWSSELIKLFQLNEVVLGTTGSSIAYAMVKDGFPAKWIAPKEISPVQLGGGISIVKNAHFQDVAHDFINHYFSTEFQLIMTRESGSVSTNKNVWKELSETEKKKLPFTPEDFDKFVMLDWTKINKNKNEWTEKFHKEIH